MRSALEVFSEWRPGRWPVSMGRWACGWKLPQVLGNYRRFLEIAGRSTKNLGHAWNFVDGSRGFLENP